MIACRRAGGTPTPVVWKFMRTKELSCKLACVGNKEVSRKQEEESREPAADGLQPRKKGWGSALAVEWKLDGRTGEEEQGEEVERAGRATSNESSGNCRRAR